MPNKSKKNSKFDHTNKFRAKKDVRVFVVGRNEVTIFVVDVAEGEKFRLRKGQKFFGEKPPELKESLW